MTTYWLKSYKPPNNEASTFHSLQQGNKQANTQENKQENRQQNNTANKQLCDINVKIYTDDQMSYDSSASSLNANSLPLNVHDLEHLQMKWSAI